MTEEIILADKEVWTFQRFKYEFFISLTKVLDSNKSNSIIEEERSETPFLSDKKYYNQARDKMYWIPICKPSELISAFIINFSDLTPRLKSEFKEFCSLNAEREIALFLKEIAARFFENLNYEYTHESVLSHLQAGLEY